MVQFDKLSLVCIAGYFLKFSVNKKVERNVLLNLKNRVGISVNQLIKKILHNKNERNEQLYIYDH